jgi:glucose 1-dehydrogenase
MTVVEPDKLMPLAGKTALVTGAGRGIGKGCALELAQAGADVILNDRPDSPDLDVTAAEVRALGRRCHTIGGDVFSRAGCEQLVAQAFELVPHIPILVSNPARSVRGTFLQYDPDDFESVIAATLTSGFHLSQLVARRMVDADCGGKIVFISSVQAEMPFALSVAYNAAKAGLNHMARTIATELAAHRINVNVIEPGWIDTPGEHASFGEETIRREAAKLPWGRLGTPSDIGKAVAYLVSDAADYVTGSVLCVDGGFRFKDCRST